VKLTADGANDAGPLGSRGETAQVISAGAGKDLMGTRPPMLLAAAIIESSFLVADLPLSQLRAMDDVRFPWLLLIPQRSGLEEWTDLDPEDCLQLAREISMTAELLKRCTSSDKLNIASLGVCPRQCCSPTAYSRGGAEGQ